MVCIISERRSVPPAYLYLSLRSPAPFSSRYDAVRDAKRASGGSGLAPRKTPARQGTAMERVLNMLRMTCLCLVVGRLACWEKPCGRMFIGGMLRAWNNTQTQLTQQHNNRAGDAQTRDEQKNRVLHALFKYARTNLKPRSDKLDKAGEPEKSRFTFRRSGETLAQREFKSNPCALCAVHHQHTHKP